jgi:hypothetical protein
MPDSCMNDSIFGVYSLRLFSISHRWLSLDAHPPIRAIRSAVIYHDASLNRQDTGGVISLNEESERI